MSSRRLSFIALSVPALGLLCLCASATAAPADAGLGTLFYSPAQRDEIVRERRGETGSAVLELTQKRLSGVVRRAGGKSTVWVNGEPLAEGAPDTPALVGMDAVVKEKRLRVGESVDALSGDTSDLVPPGAVRAGRSAPPKKTNKQAP